MSVECIEAACFSAWFQQHPRASVVSLGCAWFMHSLLLGLPPELSALCLSPARCAVSAQAGGYAERVRGVGSPAVEPVSGSGWAHARGDVGPWVLRAMWGVAGWGSGAGTQRRATF